MYHDESPRPFRFCVIACKKESYVIPIVTPDEYDIPLSPSEKDKYVVQYDVDCDGDGVYEQTAQSGDVRCELDPGAHHIAIRGVIPGLKFNTGKLSDSEESIELTEPLYTRVISLDQWGDIPWRNLSRMFTCEPADIHLMAHYTPAKGIPGGFGKAWTAVENNRIGTPDRVYNAMDTPNLQYIRKLSCVGGGYTKYRGSFEKWDVSKITDMSAMFKTYGESEVCLSCDPLLGYFDQDISKWNTSNVENTSEMFHGCQSFNQNISGWDTSKVKSMKAMFVDAKAFNQPIGKWNVSNVTNMSDMFVRAVKFNQPLESWNVSNVTDMSGMFDEAFAFNQPLAKWNVSHVEDMDSMFRYADEFNQPLDGWDVTHVKDMNNMFEGASKFQHYPANWVVPKGHVEDMFTDSPVEELAKKNPLKAKKRSK